MQADDRLFRGDSAWLVLICFDIPFEKSRREFPQRGDVLRFQKLSFRLAILDEYAFSILSPPQCTRLTSNWRLPSFSQNSAVGKHYADIHFPCVIPSVPLSQCHAHRLGSVATKTLATSNAANWRVVRCPHSLLGAPTASSLVYGE